MTEGDGGNGVEGGSARRRELLDKAFAYVTRNGISDLSLRPLAAEIGTSPRVLLYLFGSKDGLIREIMAVARRTEVGAVTGDDPPGTPVDLRRLWDWLAAEEHRPILRLFLEGYVRSFQDTGEGGGPWRGYATTAVSEWLALLGGSAEPGADDGSTTLDLAVVRGLFLDLAATGDVERTTAAFTRYLDVSGRTRRR